MTTYLCPTCSVIVRTDRRAQHEADHAQQRANTTAIAALQAGGGGGAGGSVRASFHQSTPAAEWSWVHNLNGYPAIVLLTDDDPQAPCFTDITYVDANHVLIEWPEPTSGWAYV